MISGLHLFSLIRLLSLARLFTLLMEWNFIHNESTLSGLLGQKKLIHYFSNPHLLFSLCNVHYFLLSKMLYKDV